MENAEIKKSKVVLDFFVTTMNGMAYGLFATLIIGTIFGTIGNLFAYGIEKNAFCKFMADIIGHGEVLGLANVLQLLTGAGIGVGVALAMKFDPLKTIILASVGELASFFSLSTKFVTAGVVANKFQIGDPLTVYIVVVLTALFLKYVLKKKTPVDILLVPFTSMVIGTTLSLLLRYPTIFVTYGIQWLVGNATFYSPFIMGIIIAVIMGMALTAPISSAAIAAMIFILPNSDPNSSIYIGLSLASGTSVVGCCTQMLGFAVQSRKDNSVGMVISVGIGTSMLQFKNILKKPLVWLPTIIVSAVLGPVSTCLFKIKCLGSAAGMGTSGLVGQIGTISSMGNTLNAWLGIIVLEIILPIVLVFLVDFFFRKKNWIKPGDLKI